MVVMIVADQHEIDARQILLPDSWNSAAARAQPGKGAGSFRPDWVRQNIRTVLLDEYSRMVHKCDAQLAALDQRRRQGGRNVVNKPGTRLAAAGKLPSQYIE